MLSLSRGDDFGMAVAEFDLPNESPCRVELSRNDSGSKTAARRATWRDIFAAVKLNGRGRWIEVYSNG